MSSVKSVPSVVILTLVAALPLWEIRGHSDLVADLPHWMIRGHSGFGCGP